jgi:penicillin-binding protein 2
MLANAIGYVGEVSPEQVEASDSKLKPGDIVGKTGPRAPIQRHVLMGTDGLRRVIVNSIGKEMGRLEQKDAIPGKPIQLTIDYDLQAIAEATWLTKKAPSSPWTRAPAKSSQWSAAQPSIPTILPCALPSRNGQALNTDPRTPLLNRAIQGATRPRFDLQNCDGHGHA